VDANVDRIMVISPVLSIVSLHALSESKVRQTYEKQLLLQIESHICKVVEIQERRW